MSVFPLSSPLLKYHLLNLFDDPSGQQPPLLSKYLKIDERIGNYLLNVDEIDTRLRVYTNYLVPQIALNDLLMPVEMKQRLKLLTQKKEALTEGFIFYFQGSYGVGKQTTAEALCHEFNMGLLVVDGDRIASVLENRPPNSEPSAFETTICLLCREASLQKAAIYWKGFDNLLEDGKEVWLKSFMRQMEDVNPLTILAGNVTWEPVDALQNIPFLRVEFPHPTTAERLTHQPLMRN